MIQMIQMIQTKGKNMDDSWFIDINSGEYGKIEGLWLLIWKIRGFVVVKDGRTDDLIVVNDGKSMINSSYNMETSMVNSGESSGQYGQIYGL